ncbi:MAG TPA: AfsR/SARP family transcriptional regulator [Actinophytocola sp.]|uniref:AfsR/SARP family transcriptional regulator n=1 Tax=Actinophytocola sp. TaxID=1872138 RepID=UPI002DBB1408|nr:AfsR/SARP family transcriptional regulator [Actinophytocola sp.]HEU5475372.1 AfsR/SARP family transcriptional regulator [Actinophytocola sp.]
MQVQVLGPLHVTENGRSITPTATKARQTLAMLALHAGQVVPVSTLVEELWGLEPPRKPLQSVQTYILILRRMINKARAGGTGTAKSVLVTSHGGYTLNVPAEELDVRRYERAAASGQRAMQAGDYESASRLLRSALSIWRGPALVDVQVGGPLSVKVNGLEEHRLGIQETGIEAELRLGQHQMLLGELGELSARYPMHENVCTQYMTALYRSGRKWRALEVFHKLRDTLVTELGVEPSPHVQYVQHAILNSDPRLDEPASWRQTPAQGFAAAAADPRADLAHRFRKAVARSATIAGRDTEPTAGAV